MGQALSTRKSVGMKELNLSDFRLTSLVGIASILASPYGPRRLALTGYLTVKPPATTTTQHLFNVEEPPHVASVQDLHLHACWIKQEESLASLLALVARLGTLRKLKILGFEQTLRPKVTEQLLQVVKHNRQMTHLNLGYLEEAAFPRLCGLLLDPNHRLRSLHIVLDARTPQEIEHGVDDSGAESSDDDDIGNEESDNDDSDSGNEDLAMMTASVAI